MVRERMRGERERDGAAAVMIYLPHAVPKRNQTKRNAAQRNEAIKNA